MVDFQRHMRRSDKQIDDVSLIHSILKKAPVMRLGLCYGDMPYIVPLNFVFHETYQGKGIIYLHSALKGLKIDILQKNNTVCFEVEDSLEIVTSDRPCDWAMRYLTVIGQGEASFEKDNEEKKKIMGLFMAKYSSIASDKFDKSPNMFDYPSTALDSTCLIKIEIKSLTGKKSGY